MGKKQHLVCRVFFTYLFLTVHVSDRTCSCSSLPFLPLLYSFNSLNGPNSFKAHINIRGPVQFVILSKRNKKTLAIYTSSGERSEQRLASIFWIRRFHDESEGMIHFFSDPPFHFDLLIAILILLEYAFCLHWFSYIQREILQWIWILFCASFFVWKKGDR